MEPRGAASRHWAEQACRSAGFEPDVRFETADLQAQIRLIESGNAVALMPDLVWTGRGTTAQLLDLPGQSAPDGLHLRAAVQRQAARHPGRPRNPGDPPPPRLLRQGRVPPERHVRTDSGTDDAGTAPAGVCLASQRGVDPGVRLLTL